MRIGVDVDGVVAPTPDAWRCWLEGITGYQIKGTSFDYNLCEVFKVGLEEAGMDGYDWWRANDLYDDIYPTIGSKDVLNKFKENGHEIVFISALKGNHHRSKVNFIKRFFPFYDAFLGTKEKGYVNVDVMIDDRLENLYQFDDNVVKILFWTRYRQNIELRDDILVAYDWNDVDKYLQELHDKRELQSLRAAHGIFS